MQAKRKRCDWVERDADGRPRCVHGWAIKSGDHWSCREKHRDRQAKYRMSDGGREAIWRYNNSPRGRLTKQWHDLFRIPSIK